ncbi:MAG: ribosome maturation factor RimM [Acidimicrobiia bacterium]|nr:ribosome maturation factor RimM [Acidimicrobiia bacterium]
MTEPPMLEVGRIGKAHGLGGEVMVSFVSDREERRRPGAVLRTDKGDLTITSLRPHRNKWLVKFGELADRTGAESYRGLVLWAEPLDDDDTLWVHDLIGSTVIEVDGTERGTVVAVQDNPASDLLVLDTEALVPLRFLVSGPTDGRLVVDVPAGLFGLVED